MLLGFTPCEPAAQQGSSINGRATLRASRPQPLYQCQRNRRQMRSGSPLQDTLTSRDALMTVNKIEATLCESQPRRDLCHQELLEMDAEPYKDKDIF